MIKLLVTDVDGTLLNSKREISPRNRAALIAAESKGIIICYATGRLNPSLRPIKDHIGVPAHTVTCNGAHAELADGTVIYSQSLTNEARDFVLDFAESRSISTNIYQPNRVLTAAESPFIDLYRSRVAAFPDVIGWQAMRTEIATKMIFIDHPESNAQHREELTLSQAKYHFDLTVSEPEYLEFLPKNVNKRSALIALTTHLKINQSEVAAIGDFENDIEMVSWSGYSGAMGSGSPKLKAVAKQIMPGNDDDGLAVFIEQFL